ncbi:sporangiospore maturation cell wall hydrolase GsmA [Planosporangium sp. 12N6]|uniref:sporangiospore maturation cell wall hydrolase GsmA n=1 Tax=Planosporangium spinosum TaxID=3402278 RepID=UPI003CFAB388
MLGALLATSTTGAVLGVGMEAASAASIAATVRTDGGPLNVRSSPSTQAATVTQVRNGTIFGLSCQSTGSWVSGTVRATSQWDRLTDGRWVSHAYMQTSASLPSCASVDAPANSPVSAAGPYVRTEGGPLSVRSGPSSTSDRISTINNWDGVALTCQVNGETIRGAVRTTAQWDKTASGGYVSHAYIVTGTTLPSCTAAPAPAPTTPAPAPTTPAPAPVPATYSGTADTEGGPLNVRSGPSTGASIAGQVANGGTVTMTCAVAGSYVTGTVRSTSQWNQLTSGNYVSHAYVKTDAALPTCAGGAPVTGGTGPVGSQTNAQFIAAAVAPAQQGFREFQVPPSVTIAQAILESGWGKSALTANDRNYFGIKCFNGSPGPIANGCHTYATYECTPNCYPTYASFRTYASITDSFRDHGYFLTTNSRYKPAFNYTTNADQFLYEIWKAGYATSPTYVDNVKSLMRQYNLYQYDKF